jgi:hypothetical protein
MPVVPNSRNLKSRQLHPQQLLQKPRQNKFSVFAGSSGKQKTPVRRGFLFVFPVLSSRLDEKVAGISVKYSQNKLFSGTNCFILIHFGAKFSRTIPIPKRMGYSENIYLVTMFPLITTNLKISAFCGTSLCFHSQKQTLRYVCSLSYFHLVVFLLHAFYQY